MIFIHTSQTSLSHLRNRWCLFVEGVTFCTTMAVTCKRNCKHISNWTLRKENGENYSVYVDEQRQFEDEQYRNMKRRIVRS